VTWRTLETFRRLYSLILQQPSQVVINKGIYRHIFFNYLSTNRNTWRRSYLALICSPRHYKLWYTCMHTNYYYYYYYYCYIYCVIVYIGACMEMSYFWTKSLLICVWGGDEITHILCFYNYYLGVLSIIIYMIYLNKKTIYLNN